ncbi:hypothetical protein BDD12DRAFT_893104 [Trichophaea hybrida]|nr:hypothetical protein BDD12DRAFT_893104 [Trichophaea hybrida]
MTDNIPSSSATAIFRSKHCGDILKLSPTNYLQWSSSMLDHFVSCDNANIVLGERPCPLPGQARAAAEAFRAWKVQDSQAKGAIKGACTGAMCIHIEKTNTSAEMCIKGRVGLTDKFRNIMPIPREPLSNYIGKLTKIRDLLAGTTHDIPDWLFQQQLLLNLPSESYGMTKEIMENKHVPPSTQEIIDILKRRELDS